MNEKNLGKKGGMSRRNFIKTSAVASIATMAGGSRILAGNAHKWNLGSVGVSLLRDFYKKELLDNIMPFWIKYARDKEYGGYHTCVSRDGSVYDYDKLCMWAPGRIIWTYSYLYNEMGPKKEWLDMARRGVDFVQKYGFAPDGSMYFALTRDGKPLKPAQDIYTELSTVLGFSEFARATKDEALYKQAREIFMRVWELLQTPGQAFQPYDSPEQRIRLHGHSFITINVLQVLRLYRQDPEYEKMIDESLRILIDYHIKPKKQASYEVVTWDGKMITGDHSEWISPGHMIEAGTFVIHEAKRRKDSNLEKIGINLIDWGFFKWGWDKEKGGIPNDVDGATGKPLDYDRKEWWQHAEALYALLLAYNVTGDEKFMDAYLQTHNYCFKKFADPVNGEWFAVLDRNSNIFNNVKGNSHKNSFHIARNFYWCYRLLDMMAAGKTASADWPIT